MWRSSQRKLVARQDCSTLLPVAPTPLIHVNLRQRAACHFRGIA
jgi:hypothetical protein